MIATLVGILSVLSQTGRFGDRSLIERVSKVILRQKLFNRFCNDFHQADRGYANFETPESGRPEKSLPVRQKGPALTGH
jgi:hypothetical protein